MEIKSILQEGADLAKSKCLIRFNNCTRYKLVPFWIDFKGQPIEYPALPRGASINLDTYRSHLWYFKPIKDTESFRRNNSSSPTNKLDCVKILAIPESTVELSTIRELHLNDELTNPIPQLNCPLCKFYIKKYAKRLSRSTPCPHLTGGAKFSLTDIDCRREWSLYNSNYIYSCNENTHCQEHSQTRQNIYLVEVFYNLKELCFIKLQEATKCAATIIAKSRAPTSLQCDYIQFATSQRKLEENDSRV